MSINLIGGLPESMSQGLLVGKLLVGGLGVIILTIIVIIIILIILIVILLLLLLLLLLLPSNGPLGGPCGNGLTSSALKTYPSEFIRLNSSI